MANFSVAAGKKRQSICLNFCVLLCHVPWANFFILHSHAVDFVCQISEHIHIFLNQQESTLYLHLFFNTMDISILDENSSPENLIPDEEFLEKLFELKEKHKDEVDWM